jgi:hypothetical protein
VFLVLVGVDLIIRSVSRSWPAQILRFAVTLVFVGGAFAVAASPRWAPDLRFPREPPWRLKSKKVRVPLGTTREATLRVDWEDHRGKLGALDPGSDDLLRGQLGYREDLVYDVDRHGERTEVTLDTRSYFPFVMVHWTDRAMHWDLDASPEVPLRLDLETGDQRVSLELDELLLSDLLLDAGEASVELGLPRRGGFEGHIDGSSGRITILLPAELALRLELDGGRAGFNPATRLERISGDGRDGVWETVDYAASENRATLRIDQGSGSIHVKEP